MNAATATIVVAVVGVIGAVIGSIVSAFLSRNRDDAEIADKVSQAWDPAFARMDKEIVRLDEKCTKCQKTVNLLRIDFGAFTDVVESLLPSIAGEENQRKARVAITAARLSHLTHNDS